MKEKEILIKQFLGHYKITRKIDNGGKDEIYPAQDSKLNKKILISILSPDCGYMKNAF